MADLSIYLDTNLWNRLLDQHVDAPSLVESLAARNAGLTLSQQTVHELSKTFVNDARRGQALFQYVKQCLEAGVSVAYDVMEQLHREVEVLNRRGSGVAGFYGRAEYNSLVQFASDLASGNFVGEVRASVASGVHFSKTARSGQNSHFDDKPEVRNCLRAIPGTQLDAWLDSEVQSDRGTAILTRQLLRMYVEGLSEPTATTLAKALLRSPVGLAARGLVKADLYSNWRCAHRSSLRGDLIDDMYHVLNAAYCRFYATAEGNQAEYAVHLLSDRTRVVIYDDGGSVGDWLLALPT